MMPMLKRFLVVGLLGLAGWIGVPGSAHAAVTCQVNTNPATLAFGTLSLPLNSNTSSTTVSVQCQRSNKNDSTVATMCIGAESDVSPRVMNRTAAPASTLNFDFYSDAAYSQVVGFTYNASATINMPSLNTPVAVPITLYAKMSAIQPATTPGSYQYLASNAVYGFSETANANCNGVPLGGNFTLIATATLLGSCTISASPLNFGTQTSLAANIDAQTSLTITCTNGTPYTVKLDGGTAAAFNPRKLYLNGSGPQTVNYNLYTDTGRTTVWGIGGGSGSTQTGNGTGNGQGNPQTLVVYGRVPAQAGGWTAGTYKDTVTATVEF